MLHMGYMEEGGNMLHMGYMGEGGQYATHG